MNISGSGSLPGGDYGEDIRISGSGSIKGSISCTGLTISGSGHVYGEVNCHGKVHVSGSGKIDGALHAAEVHVSGSTHIDGPATVDQKMHVSGAAHVLSLRCGELESSGALKASGDVSAEKITIRGAIRCEGLINAENVDVDMGGDCYADAIGGSVILIRDGAIRGLISRLFKSAGNIFTVKNSIEGDDITLFNVVADTVIGRNVRIGDGCRIRHVIYGESIDISEKSEVELYEPSN
ncbi:MAG: polymer-forming cytoskeletal protein [Lachnospiraceae bacterium]|nr:polymer-forming cytoskeletal protein [Lachnospiraceae bacterium]